MGGLAVGTNFYNLATIVVMLLGRFGTMIIILALAGGLVAKPRNAVSARGQLQTTTPLFALLLASTTLVVTALTFIPADALGPLAEHFVAQHGTRY
jgi:K+-transporting ATPase ATPase A chain